jgi:hypothetical protein
MGRRARKFLPHAEMFCRLIMTASLLATTFKGPISSIAERLDYPKSSRAKGLRNPFERHLLPLIACDASDPKGFDTLPMMRRNSRGYATGEESDIFLAKATALRGNAGKTHHCLDQLSRPQGIQQCCRETVPAVLSSPLNTASMPIYSVVIITERKSG